MVNLNQRSLVAGRRRRHATSRSSTGCSASSPRSGFWAACEGCDLARTLLRPAQRPDVRASERRAEDHRRGSATCYRLVHLRGQLHITLRDLRSALAFMLTSGRDCAQIHELYRSGDAEEILASFYFNSWLATPGRADRLLRLLRELDVAAVPDPALDRKLAAIGPTADHGMMTIDQRGDYDIDLLSAAFERLRQRRPGGNGRASERSPVPRRRPGAGSTSSASMTTVPGAALPFRSAERFLAWLAEPGRALKERLPELVAAINRGEGLPRHGAGRRRPGARDQGRARRDHPQLPGLPARPRWRCRPRTTRRAATWKASRTAWNCCQRPGGHVARLRIRLDLFELLEHQRDGYLPSVAELQGRYLELIDLQERAVGDPVPGGGADHGGPGRAPDPPRAGRPPGDDALADREGGDDDGA